MNIPTLEWRKADHNVVRYMNEYRNVPFEYHLCLAWGAYKWKM